MSCKVRDGASEELRRARQRCRTLEGRLRGVLKGHGGEVAEQVRCQSSDSASFLILPREPDTPIVADLGSLRLP